MNREIRTQYRNQIDHMRSYMPTTHGSAQFATPGEIARAAELCVASGGHFLGWVPQPGTQRDLKVYANLDGHTLTCAPSGGGKGTCQMLTNLLSFPGSVFVLDISKENFDISSPWRSILGKVIRFSPWSKGGSRWNPLDIIDATDPSTAEEAVGFLANLMVAGTGEEKDTYWIDAARTEAEGLTLHVATAPLSDVKNGPDVTERTMAEVLRLASLQPALYEMLLDRMAASPVPYVRFCAGSVRQAWRAPEQFAGVHGNRLEQLKPWASQRVSEATSHSDFRFEELRTPGTSMYVCIPPEFLHSHAAVVRTFVACAMRELKNSADKGAPVLFMLDEFASLGRIEPISRNLAYLRKYGVRFWFFVQSLAQLRKHYPQEWEDFIANSAYQSYFGVADLETAKMVSERVGTATVATRSYNQSGTQSWNEGTSESETTSTSRSATSGAHGSTTSGSSRSRTHGTSSSVGGSVTAGVALNFHARRLVTPEEVLALHRFEQIVFVRGMAPMRLALLPYYEHDGLLARAGQWSARDQG